MTWALVGLVVGVGLADSVNPVQIALAVVLSARSTRAVAAFVLSGFAVTLAAGLVLVAGPGAALHRWIERIPSGVVHTSQIVGGAIVLLVGAGLLAAGTRARPDKGLGRAIGGRAPAALGAGIALADLPTAFPYLSTVAAVIAATTSPAPRALLVVLYNVCYVVPLLAIVAFRGLAAQRAQEPLAKLRRAADRWGVAAAGLTASGFGGVFLARGLGA